MACQLVSRAPSAAGQGPARPGSAGNPAREAAPIAGIALTGCGNGGAGDGAAPGPSDDALGGAVACAAGEESAVGGFRRLFSPRDVVGTPAGQIHELGALMAALVAESAGWRVVYLGVDLPADEHDLRRLRRLLPRGLALFAGGDAAAAYAGVLREVDARLVESITELREALDALRRQVA